MILLQPGKTTGKQLHRIVKNAIVARTKATGKPITSLDFCRVSKLSRMSLYEYANGKTEPGLEGIRKIAAGLKAWGIEARIEL